MSPGPAHSVRERASVCCARGHFLTGEDVVLQKQASAGSADLLAAETSWAPAVIWSYQKDTSTLDIGSTAQFSVPSVDLASQTIFLGSWDGFILKFDLLSGDQAPDVWYGAGATAGIAVGVDRCALSPARPCTAQASLQIPVTSTLTTVVYVRICMRTGHVKPACRHAGSPTSRAAHREHRCVDQLHAGGTR